MELDTLLFELREFVTEREWEQFHTPQNLAKSISIESAELLECYQWSDIADPVEATDELADVLTYALLLAEKLGVDPLQIVHNKLERTRQKYPVDKAKGKSTKHDRL